VGDRRSSPECHPLHDGRPHAGEHAPATARCGGMGLHGRGRMGTRRWSRRGGSPPGRCGGGRGPLRSEESATAAAAAAAATTSRALQDTVERVGGGGVQGQRKR
jgi:hypothetical protein